MAHNLHGDIPTEHIELAAELEKLEKFFDSKIGIFENCIIAKGFTCCSYDWYSMGDEDKGALLLEKAEKVCPGYFNKEIDGHMAEDQIFNALVKQLISIILELAGEIIK